MRPASHQLNRAVISSSHQPTVAQTASGPEMSLVWRLLLIGFALGLVTGCSTYRDQGRSMSLAWAAGQVETAAKEYTKKADKKKKGKDALIWRLEQAAALRAAGKIQESVTAFDQAEQMIDDYERKAKISVSREAAAILSNQANLPYEGRAYDKVMVNTYKALNYLQLGEPEKARVELIRAYNRQQDAVEENKRRIADAQRAAEKSAQKEAIAKTRSDPAFRARMDNLYSGLNGMKAYADYVNPFTVFLDALFFMSDATGGSDLERARKSFERVLAFSGENKYIQQDLEALDQKLAGKELPPTTYVIFETGQAPVREQVRIDIPIIFVSVSYIGAAFPKLEVQSDFVPGLNVTAEGVNEQTVLVSSMDGVIGQDFKNELPAIITKTLISTVAKAAAGYGINEMTRQQGDALHIFTLIATAIYQAAVNIADTRTWTTLPKEFHYCRFPTPADRKIELTVPGSGQKIPVTVGDGTINVIYVKSISRGSPFLIWHVKLK
jgi:hypothetical protein